MKIIKSIQIRKYRSIKSLTRDLSPTALNIFVGQNDQGKSNILRALNLFFNGNTDGSQDFRFDDDYCYHANTGTGTRKEIRIDLLIQPPKNRFKHAKLVRWVKRWKRDGSVVDEKIDYTTGKKLTATNNVSKWLDKIRYRYVPAIKGPEYFSQLMGELHDVLSESHAEVLQDQGEDFIQGIRDVTEEITSELKQQIGIASSIQVPSDFRLLFSNLDFGSRIDGNTYHLKQRGDGIKVRHIPVVLKYMTDQEKNASMPGYVKPDTIWGFEEPENNLELLYAFELAEKFKEYSKSIQIFITTHSPAFYALDQTDSDNVNTYYVDQKEDCCTVIKKVSHDDTDSLHETMGLLPIITPYLTKIYEHEQRIDKLSKELDELNENIACVVLTEDKNHDHLVKYFQFNGFEIDQVEFVSYEGADQINAAIILGKYVTKKHPDVVVVIHRDRDYLDDEKVSEIHKKVTGNGFNLFVTDGVDLESQYLHAEHVHELYPQVTIEEAESFLLEATDRTKKKSVDRLIDQFFKTERPNNDGYAKKIHELEGLYDSDISRYRYGKKVCGNLKSILQRHIGENIDLFQYSDQIINDNLNELVDLIWE